MKTRFVRSSRGFSPAAGPRTPLSAWTAVAMAGAAAEASGGWRSHAGGRRRSGAGVDPRRRGSVDDETSRPVDARDVVSFLLEREHLAAAFELFQDVVESTSASRRARGARRRRRAPRGGPGRAGEVLRGPRAVPASRPARVRRAGGCPCCRRASASRRAARASPSTTPSSRRRTSSARAYSSRRRSSSAEPRRSAPLSAPRTKKSGVVCYAAARVRRPGDVAPSAADEKREQNANDASVSRHLPPLAAPNATERNALNALVADYLDRRGYRATLRRSATRRILFRLFMKDSADESSPFPPTACAAPFTAPRGWTRGTPRTMRRR